jgi:NAD(P)-dependent dehydrogenase (short-subunit alcohol dehydrogenase family)
MGSLADNSSGGAYAYRVSKAALNMASVNLARELEGDGLISVVLHPGWVKTDMGGPNAPLGIEEAVGAMIQTIGRLGRADNGGFLDRNGKPQPW